MNNEIVKSDDPLDILIAEDSPTQAEQLRYLLEGRGYRVTVSGNGREALARLREKTPNLIITDIVMPEMSGFELCHHVKSEENTQEIPVILLTSLSNPEDVLEGLAAGADSFITKPYSEDYLLANVQQILANHRASGGECVRIGVEILFGGKKRFITTNHQQILSLLISTYEAAVHRNSELVRTQEDLSSLNARLEELVEERTEALQAELAEHARARVEIETLAKFPDENPSPVIRIAESGTLLYANRASADILVGEGMAVGEPIPERWRGWITEVLDLKLDKEVEYTLNDSVFSLLFAALGTSSYVNVYGRDITERKRAEQEIAASEIRYRRLFESAKDGILILDAVTGRIVDVNPFLANILGFSHQELIGRKLWEIGIFNDIAASEASFLELQEREYVRYEDLPLETKDGRCIDVEFVSNVYLANAIKVVQCNIRDITERKRSELERQRLLTAIEQSADVIVVTDPEGVIEYVNPAFEKVTGYARGEVLGQNPRILQSGQHETSFYRAMWETISGGDTWHGRMINKHKDGTLFTEEATISPVRDASGQIVNYVAVKRDITELLKLEQQYRQAQKMEAIGQLAGGIAHDFNNILQSMMGYSEMLLAEIPETDEKHEFVGEIADATLRAAALTRQLLAFSRRQILEMEDLDLNEVVQGVMNMLKRVIGEHLEVKIRAEDSLQAIHADRGQMEQVLLNLCVNARDAMPDGGTIWIDMEDVDIDQEYCDGHLWASPGRYVALSVTDTGCGMDEQTQKRIFEPFFTTKEPGKGTGLGLATVYGIAKQHKGIVQVYSEVGTGTTFKMYLPGLDRGTAVKPAKAAAPPKGGTETLLLAEDSEELRELTLRILERAGYTVLLASDGEEALEVFEKHKAEIALCLLDVVMPKLGGKQVHDLLHQQNPQLRFLYASGYSADSLHTNFKLNQGVHLLQKPYSAATLLSKLREILDDKTTEPVSGPAQGPGEETK